MIGLFFGSFDPPHIGHASVVTTALNSGLVDKVIVVPAFKSVWKNTETKFEYRFTMCSEAFAHVPNVMISSCELALANGQPLPTYKVIEYFEETLKEDFLIVTTPETYKEIPKWQHGEDILLGSKFLIVSSTCDDALDIDDDGDIIRIIYTPNITICSTNLREKIKNGKIVQPFIQDNVVKIINALELYK